MLDAIHSHNYWVILPKHSVDQQLLSGLLQDVLADEVCDKIFLVHRRGLLKSSIQRRLINFPKAHLSASALETGV